MESTFLVIALLFTMGFVAAVETAVQPMSTSAGKNSLFRDCLVPDVFLEVRDRSIPNAREAVMYTVYS